MGQRERGFWAKVRFPLSKKNARPARHAMNATLVTRIMMLCGDMPNAARHRHYLEQLPVAQLQQRLEYLTASEKRHSGRWYGGRDIEALQTKPRQEVMCA